MRALVPVGMVRNSGFHERVSARENPVDWILSAPSYPPMMPSRADASRIVKPIILDVIALRDVTPGNTKAPMLARQEVRLQGWPENLNISIRMVEVPGAQVPQRNCPIVV